MDLRTCIEESRCTWEHSRERWTHILTTILFPTSTDPEKLPEKEYFDFSIKSRSIRCRYVYMSS